MKIRNSRSIFVIVVYLAVNVTIIAAAYEQVASEKKIISNKNIKKENDYTEIYLLDYYHLQDGVPRLSLKANKMKSVGEVSAEFASPRGIFNRLERNQRFNYQGIEGNYLKRKGLLSLFGEVIITSDEGKYIADKIDYYFQKDLILGYGGVKFEGNDPKTKDTIKINSESMRANPEAQLSRFTGNVGGEIQRKKQYEGKTIFFSHDLVMDGHQSMAHLEGDVRITRDNYIITSGKADFFLENYNKSLKYFVLNDDVRVTETLKTEEGVTQRKAFGERLEGFGREEKMVLTGAPRVEQGKDVIKGYKITIRENVDLVEVDDAMSDMEVKKKEKKN